MQPGHNRLNSNGSEIKATLKDPRVLRVTLGGMGRFVGYEDLHLMPKDCIQVTQFALQTITPLPTGPQTRTSGGKTNRNWFASTGAWSISDTPTP